MPSPGAPAPPRTSLEDSYLELLTDTLESLDVLLADNSCNAICAPLTHLDLRENACLQIWEEMLHASPAVERRAEAHRFFENRA